MSKTSSPPPKMPSKPFDNLPCCALPLLYTFLCCPSRIPNVLFTVINCPHYTKTLTSIQLSGSGFPCSPKRFSYTPFSHGELLTTIRRPPPQKNALSHKSLSNVTIFSIFLGSVPRNPQESAIGRGNVLVARKSYMRATGTLPLPFSANFGYACSKASVESAGYGAIVGSVQVPFI